MFLVLAFLLFRRAFCQPHKITILTIVYVVDLQFVVIAFNCFGINIHYTINNCLFVCLLNNVFLTRH